MALVRYLTNKYAASSAEVFHGVAVNGFIAELVILCGAKAIARYQGCYGE